MWIQADQTSLKLAVGVVKLAARFALIEKLTKLVFDPLTLTPSFHFENRQAVMKSSSSIVQGTGKPEVYSAPKVGFVGSIIP